MYSVHIQWVTEVWSHIVGILLGWRYWNENENIVIPECQKIHETENYYRYYLKFGFSAVVEGFNFWNHIKCKLGIKNAYLRNMCIHNYICKCN